MDPELKKLLAAAHAAGASDDDLGKLIDRWHADHAGPPGPVDVSDQLQAQVDARQKQAAAAPEPLGTRLAREGVNVALGIPGGQAFEAAGLSLMTGKPYGQTYPEVGQMVAPLPASHKIAGRMLGAAPVAMALPFGVIAQGALAGAVDPALAPNQTMGQRATNTALGTALGGITGFAASKLASTLPKMVQAAKMGIAAKKAPSLYQAALAHDNAVSQASGAMFSAAEQQATANGGTSPAIRAALQEPDIAPYVEHVRASRTLQGANDAKVLAEAHKLMSERQSLLNTRMVNTDDFKAGTSLGNADIGAAKQVLKQAAAAPAGPGQPPVMDLFPEAVQQHAGFMRQRDAFRDASDATRRVFNGTQVKAKNVLGKSPEAFVDRAQQYTPEQQQMAQKAVLAELKAEPKVRRIAKVLPVPSKQSYQAADLLRALKGAPGFPNGTKAPGETLMDFLAKTGLLATQPNFGTP